ncbi:unnamed protein product, partial [Prorocentrum cordatum]
GAKVANPAVERGAVTLDGVLRARRPVAGREAQGGGRMQGGVDVRLPAALPRAAGLGGGVGGARRGDRAGPGRGRVGRLRPLRSSEVRRAWTACAGQGCCAVQDGGGDGVDGKARIAALVEERGGLMAERDVIVAGLKATGALAWELRRGVEGMAVRPADAAL